MVKKIALVTGTRAEFGLLYPLIESVHKKVEDFELQLIVTGMHLSPEFGFTVEEIRESGVPIADEIEFLLSSDTSYGTAKSVGLAIIGFTDSYRRLKPDMVILLGDRFEILAAATAAMLIGIPIAHIHGGERTEGAVDESIRHSITKMSSIHFVATEEYRKRVIQLGEPVNRVYNVGAIGLDRIKKDQLISKKQLADELVIDVEPPWCTVTYHPVTLDPLNTKRKVQELLSALGAYPQMFFIFTKANADENGRMINSLIKDYVDSHENTKLFDSLGSKRYLSVVANSEIVIGNSSSGIIEVPFLHVPTLDLGIRQKGRVRGSSVFTVEEEQKSITKAIGHILHIKKEIDYSMHPYYNGGATQKILEKIAKYGNSRIKPFVDIDFEIPE